MLQELHRDLVQYAVLVELTESNQSIYNQAIQFSTFTGNMYCLFFEEDSIYKKPLTIIHTPLKNYNENRFEKLMLNKNIFRVANECFNVIAYDEELYYDEREHDL